MKNLIKRNKKYFLNLDLENINLEQKNNFLEKFKQNKTIIISWDPNSKKTNFISYIIRNSNYKNNFLYLNKELDIDNLIKNNNYLEFILRHLEDFWEKPKIIILENFENTKNIKDFISFLEKNNYKIIIISNKLKIQNSGNIIIHNSPLNFLSYLREEDCNKDIHNSILNFFSYLREKNYNKIETNNIIYKNIIEKYNLKNIDLYKYTIIFLAKLNKNISIRELNRKLNKSIKISLITMMEYLKYSIEQFIIKQIFIYDFKKQKEIETKSQFYFFDSSFRNSLYNFELDEILLKKNTIFNILDSKWYKIYSWINWVYEFDFYGALTQSLPWGREVATIFIDFVKNITLTKPLSWILSPSQEKEEQKKNIKKQINKLLKVPQIPETFKGNTTQTFKKYLILDNARSLGFTKLQYENLKIVSFEEMLEILSKK